MGTPFNILFRDEFMTQSVQISGPNFSGIGQVCRLDRFHTAPQPVNRSTTNHKFLQVFALLI